jgi:hypothetical protein
VADESDGVINEANRNEADRLKREGRLGNGDRKMRAQSLIGGRQTPAPHDTPMF